MVADTADINGGTVDGAVIGGSSAAAGTFTSLNATGGGALTGTWSNLGSVTTVDINGGTIDGAVIGGSSAAAITGTTITGTSFVSSGDMNFGDNDKAIFGAGSDLQIYHDGSASYVEDVGAGNLILKSNGANIQFRDASDNLTFKVAPNATELYYAANKKLATTSTGIDVTGTATMDGLTVGGGGTLRLDSSSTTDFFTIVQGGTQAVLTADSPDGAGNMAFKTASAGVDTTRMQILSTGDISFYEDTGTTPKFYWDASAESLGIGTSSPSSVGGFNKFIQISGTSASIALTDTDASLINTYEIGSAGNNFVINADGAERLRIDASGNVGIGTSSPSSLLHVQGGSSSGIIQLGTTGGAGREWKHIVSSSTGYYFLQDSTAGSNRIAVDTSGNVGIGTTSPAKTLDVAGIIRSSSQFQGNPSSSASSPAYTFDGDSNNGIFRAGADSLGFTTAGSEAMRITSSGNLLVGTTTTNTQSSSGGTNTGAWINSAGIINIGANSNATAVLNRQSTDGDIAIFRKDGTTVGSIGARAGDLIIGTGNCGLIFNDGTEIIIPANTTTNSVSDANVDLGYSSGRFQDIYATNGTIQTSDRNEKQDIEALSDAEQRVAVACKGLMRKFRWKSAVEEKGDEARIHFGIIAQDLQAAFEAEGLDAGRYAMFIHSTWTDEETGEERSRMGVRYSELLAFIIAAI